MYNNYFGFTDSPFSIAPDPRYLYLSEQHKDALAHLMYGVGDHGGFVLLTGEVGTGKTTICRCLLQQMPKDCEVAYVVNPRQSEVELLRSVCDELGIYYFYEGQGSNYLVDLINEYLLEAHSRGINTVLIIDEAQNLSSLVLEQLRLLTNLETDQKKLLQLILLGQPELNTKLAQENLRQLAQRITARYHLTSLNFNETQRYIVHRLTVAGFNGVLFDDNAVRQIHKASNGIPRLINVICDRCLLGAYSANLSNIDKSVVKNAISEVKGHVPEQKNLYGRLASLAIGVALLAILFAVYVLLKDDQHKPVKVQQTIVTNPNIDHAAEQLSALKALGERHGVVQSEGGSVDEYCRSLATQTWQCARSQGQFLDVLDLEMPVVVAVRQVDGSARWAVLKAESARKVELEYAEGGVRQLEAAAVSATWPSEYYWLWQPPKGYRLEVSLGENDKFVAWLRQALASSDRTVRGDDANEMSNRSRYLAGKALALTPPAVVDVNLLRRILEEKSKLSITEQGLPARFIHQLQMRMAKSTMSEES